MGSGDLSKKLSNLEAERAFISVCLYAPDVAERWRHMPPDVFVHPRYRYVWEAVLSLLSKGSDVDLITVSEELRRMGRDVGGEVWLSGLFDGLANSMHADDYARTLVDLRNRRKVVEMASALARKAFDLEADVGEEVDKLTRLLPDAILTDTLDAVSAGDAALQALAMAREARERLGAGRPLSDAPIGLPTMDNVLVVRRGHFVILAARPKIGKTMLALFWALNVARTGVPVIVVSLEMPPQELGMRLQVMQAGLQAAKLMYGGMSEADEEKLAAAAAELGDMPIHLVNAAGMSMAEIRRAVRATERKFGVRAGMVVIDYLGLVRDGSGGRLSEYERMSQVFVDAKSFAMEHDVVLLGVHQLNRAVEMRSSNRPMLSDLRGSGVGEQAGDAILFLYPPDGMDEDINYQAMLSSGLTPRVLEIAAYRHGPTASVEVAIDRSLRFVEVVNQPIVEQIP